MVPIEALVESALKGELMAALAGTLRLITVIPVMAVVSRLRGKDNDRRNRAPKNLGLLEVVFVDMSAGLGG
jgi:hypothetical protein